MTKRELIFDGQFFDYWFESNQLTLGVLRKSQKFAKLRGDLITEYLEIEKLGKEKDKTEDEISAEQEAYLNETIETELEKVDVTRIEDLKSEVFFRKDDTEKKDPIDIRRIALRFEEIGIIG